MKTLIALLVLTASFSAQALTADCTQGNSQVTEVRLTADVTLTQTSETSLVLREEAVGTLTLNVVESDPEDFSVSGEFVTLKKGAYYKDQDVNILTVTGHTKGRSITLKISNDPALRTDAERNRVIIDGFDAGVYTCSLSK